MLAELKDVAARIAEVHRVTPELITQVHREIWRVRGEIVDARYGISPCPYTQEELATLKQCNRRVGVLPPEIATQETRYILGRIFPNMQSHSVQEGNSVTNDEDLSGWFDYKVSIRAPYKHTKEERLLRLIAEDGRKLLTLNQYVVAGQDSKVFTDHYLDEVGTSVRLGSRHEGRLVFARFSGGGRLDVPRGGLAPNFRDRYLGGRSAGAKRT